MWQESGKKKINKKLIFFEYEKFLKIKLNIIRGHCGRTFVDRR